MLSRCPGLNQFVHILDFSPKKIHIQIIFHQQCKFNTNKFFFIIDSIIYGNSHLECYKKHNNFKRNKNVILKTFDSNVRVLFRETYIRFYYKQRETCPETFFRTFFFENIKIESNLNEKTVFLF